MFTTVNPALKVQVFSEHKDCGLHAPPPTPQKSLDAKQIALLSQAFHYGN